MEKKKNHSIKRQKIQLICHGICQHATRLNRAQATAPSNCIAWLISMYKKILVFFLSQCFILYFNNRSLLYNFFSTPYKVSNI